MDISAFRTDQSRENEGVWIQLGPGSKIKIGRLGSRKFRDRYNENMKPYAVLNRAGKMSEADQEKVLCQCIAESIILSWEGFTEDGKEIPYNIENALRICTENREFLLFILQQAENADNFRPDLEQSSKNSSSVSVGTSSGDTSSSGSVN